MPDLSFVVPADHPSLPGHFPGRPVVPGVVLLDRVLDAIVASEPHLSADILDRLRLPQVKFLQPLLPGEPARVEVDTIDRPAGSDDNDAGRRWRFRVLRGDVLLASGEVASA